MKISLFDVANPNETAYADSVREVSWNELHKIITQQCWAPGTFEDNHRTIKTFQQMDLFVADIDKGCTIEEAKVIFAGYRCIIGTSKSHQIEKVKKSGKKEPACDRFRIIIPLTESIKSDKDFKATWHDIKKFCPAMDAACKDASRFYFPCKEVVASWDGKPLSVVRHQPKQKAASTVTPGEKGAPNKRTLTFLLFGPKSDQTWHHEFFHACINLKQNNWTQDEATSALKKITGELDEHDLGCIDDVWNNRKPRYEATLDTADPLRTLILKCNLIENNADPNERTLLDMASGRNYNIHINKIQEILGAKEFESYRYTNKIHADFEYNPTNRPLMKNSETGVYVYNPYRPADWRAQEFWFGQRIEPLPACPEIFDAFFTHLTNNDPKSKEYLLDWMANSLRARNFTILTAIGTQGAGKGILATIFKNLHGPSNFEEATDDVFKERFNGKLKYKTIINVDEMALKTKQDHDRLKAVVNDFITIEEKGVDARTCRNWASFYITSNHLDAIQIEPGDRRFSIIELANRMLLDTKLREHIPYLTSPEAAAELGRYLLHRKITHDMFKPFRSKRFDEVRLASLQEWELWLIEDFLPKYAGTTQKLSFVLDETKEANDLKRLGRPRLMELARKFPERFKIIQDPKQRGQRFVVIETGATYLNQH